MHSRILIGLALLLSCRSAPMAQDTRLLENFVSKDLHDAKIEYNISKDVALCYDKDAGASGMIKYKVVQVSGLQIIKEGTIRPGYIKWINNLEIELLSLPGVQNENVIPQKEIISVRKSREL